ncbi:MAG: hypothetical protein K0Q59_4047 [Paenibacillus sp.]|jgi:hypothetical protein|nr:hypothetical protein [Paenibacillus sp.]
MLKWVIADSEQHREDGVRFLCRHATDLGVPYQWCTVMDMVYMSASDDGFMVALDEQGRIRGILMYTPFLMKEKGKKRIRIEIQLLYLAKEVRGGKAMARAVEAFAERELELPVPADDVEFFVVQSEANRRLYGKIASLSETQLHQCGPLDVFRTTPDRLRRASAAVFSRTSRQQTNKTGKNAGLQS